MMIFRKADINDLDEICALIGDAVRKMENDDIHQWDDVYPAREHFLSDIEQDTAYIGTADGRTAVVYAVSRECDEQYKNGQWKYTGDDFIVIHRLCVSPAFQNRGIAKETIAHIESEAKKRGIQAVRLDVFSENLFALKLYRSSGYETVGTADWRKGRFYLMEKLLCSR